MLAGILRDLPAPAVILDVGCGDGAALAVAASAESSDTSSPGSTGPPTPCARPGPAG